MFSAGSGDGGGEAAAYAKEGCSRPGIKIKAVILVSHYQLVDFSAGGRLETS